MDVLEDRGSADVLEQRGSEANRCHTLCHAWPSERSINVPRRVSLMPQRGTKAADNLPAA